jgi:hypothetical protein
VIGGVDRQRRDHFAASDLAVDRLGVALLMTWRVATSRRDRLGRGTIGRPIEGSRDAGPLIVAPR